MLRYLASLIILCSLFTAPVSASVSLPPGYPVAASKTCFVTLDHSALTKAKAEAPTVAKFKDWNKQLGYWLGSKSYNGFLENYSPINFQLVTPYSAARYLYYKSEAQLKPVNQEAIDEFVRHNNVVWVWTWAHSIPEFGLISQGVSHVVIRKGEFIYQPLPESYNPASLLAITPSYSRDFWAFPIELFDGTDAIEIIAVDKHDKKKAIILKPEKQISLQ